MTAIMKSKTMVAKSQKSDSELSAVELSEALFEMRDSLVNLSLALKDALFEAHVLSQSTNTEINLLQSGPDDLAQR